MSLSVSGSLHKMHNKVRLGFCNGLNLPFPTFVLFRHR